MGTQNFHVLCFAFNVWAFRVPEFRVRSQAFRPRFRVQQNAKFLRFAFRVPLLAGSTNAKRERKTLVCTGFTPQPLVCSDTGSRSQVWWFYFTQCDPRKGPHRPWRAQDLRTCHQKQVIQEAGLLTSCSGWGGLQESPNRSHFGATRKTSLYGVARLGKRPRRTGCVSFGTY